MKKLLFFLLLLLPFAGSGQTVITNGIQSNSPFPLDNKYAKRTGNISQPYESLAEVNTTINPAYRYKGLTVLVNIGGENKEYWYKDGTLNGQLVLKAVPGPPGPAGTGSIPNYVLTSEIQTAAKTGDYLSNVLDENTLEPAVYKKVTKWEDGRQMTDEFIDHALYTKVGADYFKRSYDGSIDVRWLGVRTGSIGDTAHNTKVLNDYISRLPYGSTLDVTFPKGQTYFARLDSTYWAFKRPTCIKTTSLNATFRGEIGAQVIAPAQCGLFTNITGFNQYINLNISSLGYGNMMDGRRLDGNGVPLYPVDDIRAWSNDAGDYIANGINAFGQAIIHNCNISGFSGNGVFVYGEPQIRLPNAPKTLHGTKNGGSINFIEPVDINWWNELTTVYIGQQQVLISGRAGTSLISESYDNAFRSLPDGPYDFTLKGTGPGLIADNGQITGISNFDFNGATGIYLAGADGNQWSIVGLSCRENGFWGILDASFLGTHVFGAHGSRNGKHFNIIDHPTLPAQYNIGSFATVNLNGRSTWIGCYTEQGNQGPDYYERFAVVLGGIHAGGVTGPGFYYSADGPFPAVVWGHTRASDKGLDFTTENLGAWHFGLKKGDEIGGNTPDVIGFSNGPYESQRGYLDISMTDGRVKMKDVTAGKMQVGERQQLNAITSLSAITYTGNILKGSNYINAEANRFNNAGWLCVGGGLYNPPAGVYGFYPNGPTLVFATGHPFKSGDIVVAGGTKYQLLQTDSGDPLNAFYVSSLGAGPAGSPAGAIYAKAEFKATGTGVGLLAERPAASADLNDFLYYGTDTGIWYRCTGTAWL